MSEEKRTEDNEKTLDEVFEKTDNITFNFKQDSKVILNLTPEEESFIDLLDRIKNDTEMSSEEAEKLLKDACEKAFPNKFAHLSLVLDMWKFSALAEREAKIKEKEKKSRKGIAGRKAREITTLSGISTSFSSHASSLLMEIISTAGKLDKIKNMNVSTEHEHKAIVYTDSAPLDPKTKRKIDLRDSISFDPTTLYDRDKKETSTSYQNDINKIYVFLCKKMNEQGLLNGTGKSRTITFSISELADVCFSNNQNKKYASKDGNEERRGDTAKARTLWNKTYEFLNSLEFTRQEYETKNGIRKPKKNGTTRARLLYGYSTRNELSEEDKKIKEARQKAIDEGFFVSDQEADPTEQYNSDGRGVCTLNINENMALEILGSRFFAMNNEIFSLSGDAFVLAYKMYEQARLNIKTEKRRLSIFKDKNENGEIIETTVGRKEIALSLSFDAIAKYIGLEASSKHKERKNKKIENIINEINERKIPDLKITNLYTGDKKDEKIEFMITGETAKFLFEKNKENNKKLLPEDKKQADDVLIKKIKE